MNIGGMQITDGATYAPSAHRRSAGNDAHAVGDGKLPGREGVFIHKRQRCAARLGQFAQPEAQQNAVFHPGVDHPAAVDFFGGADLALGEGVTEFEKCRTRLGIVFDFAQRGQTFDGSFQGLHAGKV